MRAVLKLAVNGTDGPDLRGRNLVALGTERVRHPFREVHRVYQLHLALADWRFVVGKQPDVGSEAGVVEKLVGQVDNRLQPVILEDPSANVALPRTSITRVKGRAVECHSQPRAFRLHFA